MTRIWPLLLAAPLLVAAKADDRQAVRATLDKIIASEPLPNEILDRQAGHPEFPDLDMAIANAKGCKVSNLDSLQNGSFGVVWHCKGRKKKDQPSAMMIYAARGQVSRITTAIIQGF